MGKCVNENCNKDPLLSTKRVLVNGDGDFACSPECKRAFEGQMNRFCTEILPDDNKFSEWMGQDLSQTR